MDAVRCREMEPAIRRLWLGLLLAWAHAALADEALYRLPWPDGLRYMFTQAPRGRVSTHIAVENLHAVDIGMPEGTRVLAARAGVVDGIEAGHDPGADEDALTEYGNFVRVRHADGTVALYAHLRHGGVAVRLGERVEAGTLLGFSGASGNTIGAQLHFGVARIELRDGRQDLVSLPPRFYVGQPPIVFEPRAGLIARARYDGPAERPYTALETPPLLPWTQRSLTPQEEMSAWLGLFAWFAAGLGGMVWFWWFSRR